MAKYIIVRMDDICPTMDYEKFLKYFILFQDLGIRPLLGIVPDCRDEMLNCGRVENFWPLMRDLQQAGCPIAMHGYHHQYTTDSKGLVCRRPLSEFAGIPLSRQEHMLKDGREKLEENGIRTDIFMPPGHSYDKNTLNAMRRAGFRYLTDGKSFMPYELCGITCIPATSSRKLYIWNGILTVCVHSNNYTDKDFNELKALLEHNRDKVIDFYQAEQLKTRNYHLCRMEEHLTMFTENAMVKTLKLIRGGKKK